jgi:heptosyltransferase-2
MKIAIIQPLGLGDVVLSLSLVQTLKKAMQEVRIAMVVRRSLSEIPANHPDIDSVIPIHNERSMIARFLRLVSDLSDLSCDVALICPGSLTAVIAASAARIPMRIGSDQTLGISLFKKMIRYPRLQYQTSGAFFIGMLDRIAHYLGKPGIASWYLTDIVPFDPDKHAADRFCSLLHPLGIYEQPVHPRIIPLNESVESVEKYGNKFGIRWEQRPIALVPGSRWATKQWGEDRYALLATELVKRFPEKDILLCGDTDDKELCGRIAGSVKMPYVKDLSGLFSLDQLAELFRRCMVVVGNDSGPGHFAAAVGTPVITLFGPTVPEFGFFPLGPKSVVIEGKALECRPCGPYGGMYCPVKTHECMRGISVDKVMNVIEVVLGYGVSIANSKI